jgi:histidinol dehydrogenase
LRAERGLPGETANLFAFFPDAPTADMAAVVPSGQDSSGGDAFLDLAAALVNEYAPEHLEVHVRDARAFLPRVEAAGAVFLGGGTPTTFGDYVAGSNHVLPTGGSARFASPLSVDTFVRKSSVIELGPGAAGALAPPLAAIADAEGFYFHKLSALLRSREGRSGGD